jgi:hypothetical protein
MVVTELLELVVGVSWIPKNIHTEEEQKGSRKMDVVPAERGRKKRCENGLLEDDDTQTSR